METIETRAARHAGCDKTSRIFSRVKQWTLSMSTGGKQDIRCVYIYIYICIRSGLLAYRWLVFLFYFLSPFRARSHCGFSNEIKKPWRRKAKHTTLYYTTVEPSSAVLILYIHIILYYYTNADKCIISYSCRIVRSGVYTTFSCVHSTQPVCEYLQGDTLFRPRCSNDWARPMRFIRLIFLWEPRSTAA